MLSLSATQIEALAQRLAQLVSQQDSEAEVAVAKDVSLAGGGSLPTVPFETWVVRVRRAGAGAERIAAALRSGATPVICRIQAGWLVFDCRTLTLDEVEAIPAALAEALAEASGS
jgi:seryl-tRNA(Sec) selenium transferase